MRGLAIIRNWKYITAGSLLHESNLTEFEIAIGMLKKHKSFGTDQIPSELVQAGSEILRSGTHKHMKSM
jgi:hypothetical protein